MNNNDRTNLAQVVYDMVETKKQNTPEFRSMVGFWGRQKLLLLYLQEKERRRVAAGGIPLPVEEKPDPFEDLGYRGKK